MPTTTLGEKVDVLVNDMDTWEYDDLLRWAKEARRNGLENSESEWSIKYEYSQFMADKQ